MDPRVFRLSLDGPAPRQQSSVTCGCACLTVARMQVDPLLAEWVATGAGAPCAPAAAGAGPAQRFAAYEQTVLARTNGVEAPWGWQVPWPRALGTSPWGAVAELEHGASAPGNRYDLVALRGLGAGALGAAFDDVMGRVEPGAPVLLYVGQPWLPRHVVLVSRDETQAHPVLYDPGEGRVTSPSRAAFVEARLALSGWDVPWFALRPTTVARSRSRALAAVAEVVRPRARVQGVLARARRPEPEALRRG